jgi:hypothetical protein
MYCLDIATGGKIGQVNFLEKMQVPHHCLGNDVIVTFAGDKYYSLHNLVAGIIGERLGDIQPPTKDDYIYLVPWRQVL